MHFLSLRDIMYIYEVTTMSYNPTKGLVVLNGVTLPLNFINEKSYKYTPHSRTDLDSGLNNATGYLVRSVFTHTRSKIEFETRPLWGDEWAQFISHFNRAYKDALEKKVSVEYWDSDINGYSKGDFYVPDYTPQIDRIENDRIKYASCRFALIEY